MSLYRIYIDTGDMEEEEEEGTYQRNGLNKGDSENKWREEGFG